MVIKMERDRNGDNDDSNTLEKTILIISIHFPPMRGGVETMNWQYIDYLESQKRFKAIVLTYDTRYKQAFEDYWRKNEILRIKVNKRVLEFMTSLKIRLDSFPEKIAYILLHLLYLSKGSIVFYNAIKHTDAILANGGPVETMFGYILSIILKKKLLIRWRTSLNFYLTNPINNFILKTCLKRAATIVVNGKDIEGHISKLTKNKKSVKVFSAKQTVDTSFFHPIPHHHARNSLQLRQDKFIILFAAVFNETKFCDIIVNSAYQIIRQNKDCFYIFIGQGPLENMVKELSASFPDNVLFINHLVDPQTLSLYINASNITIGSADVYYPGNFILESLACGTPVLLFNTSIHLEKRNEALKFEIPLPHIFLTDYSINGLIQTLLVRKEQILSVKNNPELVKTAQQYIVQNYEKFKVLKEEFNEFNI
jgi:glycosyltransferase involved in cell wall biosynthesis